MTLYHPPANSNFKATPPKGSPQIPTSRSSRYWTYKADLIVASVDDDTVVLKNRQEDPKKTNIVDAICRLLSRHFFRNKYKMFIPSFEKDLKEAIENVVKNHHLKGDIHNDF